MPVLTAMNISHAYGDVVVLDGVSLSIEPNERVGMVGRNGAGKSTLLKIMAGLVTPDAGAVALHRGARASYLAQDPAAHPGRTLRDEAEAAFAEVHALHEQLHAVFDAMAGASGAELEKLLRRQAELEHRIDAAGGVQVGHRVERVLHGLGFVDEQFELPLDVLSGGQRSRLALARALLEDPDVLLLDEPTNHLDIAGREWLESFLRSEYRGAVVLVSHDRYLLDHVVDRIIETEHARLIEYPGNYEAFCRLRGERRLAQQRAFENQQTIFRREEAFIRKYKAGQRAKQARGRASKLERMKEQEAIERPVELATLRLALPRAERPGELVITARDLAKAYADDDGAARTLFTGLTVTIGRGERWGIIGPNGAGKTTLVRTLLGQVEPDRGAARLGTRLSIGYYSQTHEGVDPELSVYQYLQKIVRRACAGEQLSEQAARDLAGAFLFSGPEQEKPMGVLSGGERSRAVLAGLLASAKNLLILDEPTNHLDIPSSERLEQALALPERGGSYDGALIVISHDRAFLDATCDHLIVLDGRGGAEVFHGSFGQWHEAARARSAAPDAAGSPGPAPRPATRPAPPAAAARPDADSRTRSRFSWMGVEQLEARIAETQTRLRSIDAELAEPDIWKDVEQANRRSDERDAVAAELDELETEWLRKAE